MPGVKRLHQESENSGKTEFIFGHMFGFIGVLVGNGDKLFCLPLSASLHDGDKLMRKWEDEWETPQDFFDMLDRKYHFTLDVCATPSNAKCPLFFTRAEDGLSQPWRGICWMNPPYGREIGLWIKKAYKSSLETGTVVVCLLPARTDTRWWHEYVMAYAENIEFIRGRLRFSGKAAAPFPSALVVFGRSNRQNQPLSLFGQNKTC